MSVHIEGIVQRARRYWYDDGLAEMASGVIFVWIGLLFLAEALMWPGAWSGFAAASLPVVAIGGGLLARWLLRVVKDRLVYPRTGYVRYRRAHSRRLVTSAVAAAMAGALAALVPVVTGSRDWLPALIGVLIGIGWAWLGRAVGVTRYYALGAASAIIGLAVGWARLGDIRGSAVYFGLQGLAAIASGALSLRAYLARTSPVDEEGGTRDG